MKARWLKFVLGLTNRIYRIKQSIIKKEGLAVVSGVVSLFFYELFLALVSLPLYLGIKPEKVTAFFQEKGTYEKVSYDYSLRRILTLTGVGILFLIWLIKLVVIVFTPNVVGPMKLYNIVNLAPATLTENDLLAAETQIQTATVFDVIKAPKITAIEKMKNGGYAFIGTGQPLTSVVLFLSDKQTAVYTEAIDDKGNWRVEYAKKDFKLSEGNHGVVAFCYDEKTEGRSRLSGQQYFKVTSSWLERLVNSMDVFLNLTLVIVLFLGIFLIILTI